MHPLHPFRLPALALLAAALVPPPFAWRRPAGSSLAAPLGRASPAERSGQGARAESPSGFPWEDALAARVDEERAAKQVRALVALGPRMGGTASGERAAEHLAGAFAAIGLEVRIERDPETWAHEESAWKVSARRGDELRELESAWPYGFSPSARGRARLALEPEGGAALLAAAAPRWPRRGREGTTPALVLVDGSTTSDGSFPLVHHLRAGEGNPAPVFGLSRPDGELLRRWLVSGALVEIAFELEAQIRRAQPRTVVVRLPARGESGEPWSAEHLLFCAHGDSDAGGPGADDNASGVAVVLEIARAWSEAIAAGEAPAPAREVRFAVWGKEIHSSRAYLEREGERLLGVINFDQAGFGSGADQVHVEPDDLEANRGLVLAAAGVLAERAGSEGFPRRWVTNRSLGGTDSYVFSGSQRFRELLLPAVTIFSSAWGEPAEHPRTPGMPGESWSERDVVSVDHDIYYHSAGDTPENTTDREPWNMAWCARTALLTAARWLEGLEEARR